MNLWLDSLFIRFVYSNADIYKMPEGSLPYMAYFSSYHRGVCSALMISRMAALTAAVCLTNPVVKVDTPTIHDTRPINLVIGTTYRHPLRGIRVQVTKLLLPKMSHDRSPNSYIVQTSVAIMLLKTKVPDVLTEFPVRPAHIDLSGGSNPDYHEECLTSGWHFFQKHIDVIYHPFKFLLSRNIRGQFINVVKTERWCGVLLDKFQSALNHLNYSGNIDKNEVVCTKDADGKSQPCHGMYGSPLICRGRIVAMLTIPDAQWSNCTGTTNLYTRLDMAFLTPYFDCTRTLFEAGETTDFDAIKAKLYDMPKDSHEEMLYDRVVWQSSSSSESMAEEEVPSIEKIRTVTPKVT